MSRDGGGVHVTRRDRSRSRDRRGDAAGREPPRVAAAATPPLVVAFVDQRAEAEAEHDPEYDGAFDDSAFTTMGRLSSECDGVEHVGLTASRGGEKIGSASLVLVDRDRVRNFHAVCDAESADLQARRRAEGFRGPADDAETWIVLRRIAATPRLWIVRGAW